MYLAVGADVSVNHSCIFALDMSGKPVMVRYLTAKVKDTKKSLGGTRVIPYLKTKYATRQDYEVVRLMWLKRYYDEVLESLAELAVEKGASQIYLAIEGFAYTLAARGKSKAPMTRGKPYQIGEVAGFFKIICKELGFRLRIHDPTSVKMFATDRGNAPKEDVTEAAIEKLAGVYDVSKYPAGDVLGDLGDAWTLANMARTEVEVRKGNIEIKDLERGERRVFLRVTSKYPVNILARPWL